MFGLSWDQIFLILLAGLFLLGPERIPTAIKWLMDSLRKVRTFAAGAQTEMRSQLGPELDELRRQIAELQSLKELKELRELRDLDPRRMVGKSLLGDEFAGGMKGFLGLDAAPQGAVAQSGAAEGGAGAAANGANGPAPAPAGAGGADVSAASGASAPAEAPTSTASLPRWTDADVT